MNLGQIRTQIDRRTGRAQDASAANAYINEALQIISTERDWPWLDGVSTYTANSASTTLPTDWAETRSVNIAGFDAPRYNVADVDQFTNLDLVDVLYVYAIEGGSLYIFPNPSATSTVDIIHRYVKVEHPVVADADEPLMPTQYHSLICDLAASLFLERLEPDRAAYYRKSYQEGLKRMISGCKRAFGPQRIRVRAGGWY